ncbi:MAG: hypothetical protein ACOCRK_02950 [bacterium]
MTINCKEILKDGFVDIEGQVIYTVSWEEQYIEKNIEFFRRLIVEDYDELILAKSDSKNIFFDLVILRHGNNDLVLPLPVVMESLIGKDYNGYKEFITESALVWIDSDDDYVYRLFDTHISREDYYSQRLAKDNFKKLSFLKKLLQEKFVIIEKDEESLRYLRYKDNGTLIESIHYYHRDNNDDENKIPFITLMEIIDNLESI